MWDTQCVDDVNNNEDVLHFWLLHQCYLLYVIIVELLCVSLSLCLVICLCG